MPAIVARHAPPALTERLAREGLHPVLARIYAARGVASARELSSDLGELAPPGTMLNLTRMAGLLADAISAGQRLLIVGDYDADGATACAVGVRALRSFGARVDYLVPNRFEYGYGLTPEIARLAHERFQPGLLVTVDNGISSIEGVAECNRLGMNVLITDHHLPGPQLPAAACIINPNQGGCAFPSKHLAGVGVMFYLMVALRAELRARHGSGHPNLAELLPLVALGTVADVVPLDRNNRVLVEQGLQRIRAGRIQPGLDALFRVASRDARRAGTRDLAFAVAPRLNAAGRLTDMALGVECLITEDPARALQIAGELDRLNHERRAIELGMQDEALAAVEAMEYSESYTLSLFNPAWHQGVIGILAGRMKDRFHRPTIAFARTGTGELRGSGRSIEALHLRDALERIAVRCPGLIDRFGGHAAAAGLTLREAELTRFRDAFEEAARALLTPADLERVIETDGELAGADCSLELAQLLKDIPWGQGFPRPSFHGPFDVLSQRIVGERHLRLRLSASGRAVDAMLFGSTARLPGCIVAVYRLEVSEYQGLRSLQLTLDHWDAASA
ncbi:MAG TPA: single-stranded-DNA-specific exonuclease RecJ [Burkholderiales bacterium]|nr:single-stranded-DNA-specific exonuclease RecJ [Burkholderiales bacterium]